MLLFNLPRKIFSRKSKSPKWSIVIDPGHGGKDSGAVNKTYGYMEKNINLAVGNYMRRYIRERVPKLISCPTRLTDTTVSLPGRCQIANDFLRFNFNGKPADAFISIHTNARPMRGRHGIEFETYYHKSSAEGWHLSSAILDELLKLQLLDIPIIDRGVKVGERRSKSSGQMVPFYVLKHTAMPACLVELGFLSDDEEARILVNSANQELMAMAIVDGVVKYLRGKEEE